MVPETNEATPYLCRCNTWSYSSGSDKLQNTEWSYDLVAKYFSCCKLNNICAAVSQHGDVAVRKEERSKRKVSRWKELRVGLVVLACDKRDRSKHTKINKRLIWKAWGMSFVLWDARLTFILLILTLSLQRRGEATETLHKLNSYPNRQQYFWTRLACL